MLARIQSFFLSITEDSVVEHDEISLEMACTVLLCEVMRADGELAIIEQDKLVSLLKAHLHLSTEEIEALVLKAVSISEQATDFYQFTSKINRSYQVEEKIQIVSMLWQVALADGEIAAIEEHIIRRIADLLHLRHSEYIKTKPKIN